LPLITDHTTLKWIWDIKSTVHSRLFKWSLILNPLKDKVTIIHRPGRLHSNVNPLSRYPVANTVNLLHVQEKWKATLRPANEPSELGARLGLLVVNRARTGSSLARPNRAESKQLNDFRDRVETS